MVFHRTKKEIDVNNPSLSNIALKRVNYSKFLGVIIDDCLKWTNHISYVKNKMAKGFGIILRARRFFNRKTLLNLYHLFIFSYLIYCFKIWGNAAVIYLHPLNKTPEENCPSNNIFKIYVTSTNYVLLMAIIVVS